MEQRRSSPRSILAVLGGGFCGTLLRVLLSNLVQRWLGNGFPFDILLINVSGAMVLAFVTTLADAKVCIGPTRRLFINVGLLGAYTTFSSLALGDVVLVSHGRWLEALFYILLSAVGGVTAVLVGDIFGQWTIRAVRPLPLGKTAHKPMEALLDASVTDKHVDVQDDLWQQERE